VPRDEGVADPEWFGIVLHDSVAAR
jgi:hypothetical protein